MGRVIQQAAAYPFARVIGVEISEELNEIARLNVARNRRRFACQCVDFIACDAVEFRVPDDMTHVYLHNPFTCETFRKVLQNIITSIDRAPRRVVLIYDHPTMGQALEETGRFHLVGEKKTAARRKALIYESRPLDATDGGARPGT